MERCLDAVGRDSCAYFTGYGANTGAMWRSFLVELDKAPTSDTEEIGRGALVTFEHLGRWLAKG